MSVRSVTRDTWTRVFVDTSEDFATADRVLLNRLGGDGEQRGRRLQVSFVVAAGGSAQVYEFAVVALPEQLVTVEPGKGVPLLQDVEARLQWAGAAEGMPHEAWFAIAQTGLLSSVAALEYMEADINTVRAPMAAAASAESSRSMAVSDLPRVSELLVDIDHALSYVAASVASLTQLARLLRRESIAASDVMPRQEIDALIQQGEALTRRVEFMVDRHRFLSQGVSQQISTSDLNIVKIFTVLWAILIPGTTLINWYGQNFEVMPELSWDASAWVQILGVFFLAVIPIYTVKRAGQLR